MRNALIIKYLRRVQGVSSRLGARVGATLKNFFAYFSASMSY